jgi:hypothetical protein
MKQILLLALSAFVISGCSQPTTTAQENTAIDYVGIGTLIVTTVGWLVTSYFQSRILDRQKQAEKEIKSLEFAQRIALSKREQKFEILPQARFRMLEAYSAVEALSSPVIQYPDLNSWVPAQLNEWVKDLEFTDFQKEGLLNSTDKNKYYLDTKFLYDARKATIRVDEFHNYLVSNKLLIDDELFLQFTEMENILNEVLSGATFAHQEKDPSIGNHYAFKLGMDAFPLIAKIEKMIRERLDQNFPLES